MEKKRYLSAFEHSMVAGGKWPDFKKYFKK